MPHAAPEVIEFQPRQWRAGRGTKVTLALVAALLMLAVVVDNRVRNAEEAAIDDCAQLVASATSTAMSPVTGMVNYLRSARYSASLVLARDLDRMVSSRADDAQTTLAPAYEACEAVRVLWHHWATSDRQQECLSQLAAWTAYFEAVRADGGTAFRASERLESSC